MTVYSVIRFVFLTLVTTLGIATYGCESTTRNGEAGATIQNFNSFSKLKIGYEPLK
jgi:hypothetical protein